MEKLGIVVDGLQIQEIEDPTGYIANLAAPHAAAVASAARIAAAERDKEAAEKEQEAARAKAQFAQETSILQAKIQAEVQEAQARAAQAGPLAVAKAQQDVIAEQTALAVREAELTEKKLESQVRRPADAEAHLRLQPHHPQRLSGRQRHGCRVGRSRPFHLRGTSPERRSCPRDDGQNGRG
jgi:hypothetical protein